jgi:hypothetical protein
MVPCPTQGKSAHATPESSGDEQRRQPPDPRSVERGTAIEQGMLLISADVRHMDLLLQIRPSPNFLLYRPA